MVSKTDLIKGVVFWFGNDLIEGFIKFDKFYREFLIFYNDKLIHSSTDFESAKNKLEQLFKDNNIEYLK